VPRLCCCCSFPDVKEEAAREEGCLSLSGEPSAAAHDLANDLVSGGGARGSTPTEVLVSAVAASAS